MTSRQLRFLRAAAVSAIATLLAAVSHTLAGGAAPHPLLIAAVATLFAWLREQQGLATGEELMTIEDVKGSDGAWLLSSTRLAAPITYLDEHELPVDAELTARFERVLKGGI